MKVYVIVPDESAERLADADVYQKTLLTNGYSVQILVISTIEAIPRKIANNMLGNICIYIDRIMPSDIISNAINCLILNQELFTSKTQFNLMKKIQYVFCKTQLGFEFAEAKKTQFTYKSIFIGHTLQFPKPTIGTLRSTDVILHIAGCNKWKGTDLVINTWLKYPDLPKILITGYGDSLKNIQQYISSDKMKEFLNKPNVYFIQEELTFDQIITLKHENYFHLQPSITSGFGRGLTESMACGGICITTDSQPMNELITQETGFLIPVKNNLPTEHIDIDELYNIIMSLEDMTDKQIQNMSKAAYKKYKTDKVTFETNLLNAVSNAKRPGFYSDSIRN